MGLIFGKLMKKSAVKELENIDKEIRSLEQSRKNIEKNRRKIVGRFLGISVLVYICVAFVFYFFFFPASFYDRIYYILPLLITPLLIAFLKQIIGWYYNRQNTRIQSKVEKLREKKKRIVDEVLETETYKVAKQVLDNYGTDVITPVIPSTALRQRNLPKDSPLPSVSSKPQFTSSNVPSIAPLKPNVPISSALGKQMITPSVAMYPLQTPINPGSNLATPVALPTPKSILPRDRSVFDKMVDYLVGDGPSNRFALICQYCYSHNGMALREEAKYTSFRCCYCFAFNPAIVKKPQAPRLDLGTSLPHDLKTFSSTESDQTDSTDSENEEEDTKANVKTDIDEKISFSEIKKNLTEIESTIAEMKKADVEKISKETNSELSSFEFINLAGTSDIDEKTSEVEEVQDETGLEKEIKGVELSTNEKITPSEDKKESLIGNEDILDEKQTLTAGKNLFEVED